MRSIITNKNLIVTIILVILISFYTNAARPIGPIGPGDPESSPISDRDLPDIPEESEEWSAAEYVTLPGVSICHDARTLPNGSVALKNFPNEATCDASCSDPRICAQKDRIVQIFGGLMACSSGCGELGDYCSSTDDGVACMKETFY